MKAQNTALSKKGRERKRRGKYTHPPAELSLVSQRPRSIFIPFFSCSFPREDPPARQRCFFQYVAAVIFCAVCAPGKKCGKRSGEKQRRF